MALLTVSSRSVQVDVKGLSLSILDTIVILEHFTHYS